MLADVLIVGAGPAGTSTALSLLRQGITVAIVASNREPVSIPVDVLSPELKAEFASLGIQSETWTHLGVACHGIDAAWGGTLPVSYSFLQHPYGDGVAIGRSELHRLLLRCAIDGGALHHTARFVGAESMTNDWQVRLQRGETTEQVQCRVLVDATGRASVISRYMGARFRCYDTLCGVGGLLDNCKHDRVLSVISTTHGWWYSAPAPDGRTLVCFLSDADVLRRIGATQPDVWTTLFRPIARALSSSVPLPHGFTLAVYPCESAVLKAMGTAWIAVGDAAARFDPLAARGVHHAIRSGRTATDAIVGYLRGNTRALIDFASAELTAFAAYMRGRQHQYGLERRFSQHAFWSRRTATDGRLRKVFKA